MDYENKWQVWRTTDERKVQHDVKLELRTTEPAKLFPIFNRTSAKIKKPKLNITGENEATDFAEKEDTHCIAALLEYEETSSQKVQVMSTSNTTTDQSHCKKPPECVVTESSTLNQNTENLEPMVEYEESSSSKVQVQPTSNTAPDLDHCKKLTEFVVTESSTVDQYIENLEPDTSMK